ncbi:uncharacterized protein DS421_11g318490 [Arachis hypogaea]|nr:uncharacterized protein DS421_11g318490 [Arachis hypogaea]
MRRKVRFIHGLVGWGTATRTVQDARVSRSSSCRFRKAIKAEVEPELASTHVIVH